MERHDLEAVLAAWLGRHPSVPGVVVRVERPHQVVTACRGYADRQLGEPLTPDHAMRIASNTKTFVAAAVVSLASDGVLALDDAVAPLLPGPVAAALAERYELNAVTVRMLLQHTSGIAEHCGQGGGGSSPYFDAVRSAPGRRWSALEQVEYSVRRFGPTGRPGASVSYSDTGYVVLGQLVEHVTGEPLPAVVRARCHLDALGLRRTWWESLEPAPTPPPARLRVQHGAEDWEAVDCSLDLFGGGGLVSTVDDLGTWWRALFAGEVVDGQALGWMLAPLEESDAGHGAAGLGLFRRSLAGRIWWAHSGYWGSLVLHDPREQLTITAFHNQAEVPGSAFEPLVEALTA